MTAPAGLEDGVFIDLSARVKLRISGTDRLRFLNGQLTNDVRKATASVVIQACVLNAKGKMDAHLFLVGAGDAFLLDADAELRESLPSRLERYIIADDVQVADVTEQLSIFHVVPADRTSWPIDWRVAAANRFALAGWDIWIASTERDRVVAQLSQQFAFCDADCAEVFRIEQGIPRWGRELTAEIIPVEANLEDSCIDYEKGCYIGQETISRMKMSGQRNKRLCGLASADDAPLSAGMQLYAATEPGKEVGWITSAAQSSRLGKPIALGYVKRGFNDTGTMLNATAAADKDWVLAQIVELPFAAAVQSTHVSPIN